MPSRPRRKSKVFSGFSPMCSCFSLLLLRFGQLFRSLLASRGGNTAITFGIAAIPLLGALGAALDFARVAKMRSTLQSAMDASVLAGLAAASGSEINTATRIFNANLNDTSASLGTPSYTLDTTCGCLTGSVAGTVSMSIMTVLGVSTTPVSVTSKASNKKTTTKVLNVTVTPTHAQGWYP